MIYTDVTSRALSYLLKEPDLHIDMTEAIYRGLGEICYAERDGVLLLIRAKTTGAPLLYEISVSNRETGARLFPQMPKPIPIVAHQAWEVEVVTEGRESIVTPCVQAVWPSLEPPKRDPAVEIWPLDLGDLPMVQEHYHLVLDSAELAERITSGNLFGACVEDQLAGFIGVHTEGAMGMLVVREPYRGRGIGAALETYLIRQELRRGHIPYSQMFGDNQRSIALQKKVGMELKKQPIWWLLPVTEKAEIGGR